MPLLTGENAALMRRDIGLPTTLKMKYRVDVFSHAKEVNVKMMRRAYTRKYMT